MRTFLRVLIALLLAAPLLRAEPDAGVSDELVSRIVAREHQLARSLERYHPIVETYIQVMNSHKEEPVISYDRYYISLAEFSGGLRALRFKPGNLELWRQISDYTDTIHPTTVGFNASGFVAMAYPDPGTFDQRHYRFNVVGRESLGEVRCLVLEVSPTAQRKRGLFEGRIWVEEQNDTIIRFDGVYDGSNFYSKYFHFDSRRVEAAPGQWFPSTIYSQEINVPCCGIGKFNWSKVRFQAQTRFWGYAALPPEDEQEFTQIVFEPAHPVDDTSASSGSIEPSGQQTWEQQAESNVTEQLERIGLLSPVGEVDKALETVLNKIEAANHLSTDAHVRCRILLTSNLESAVVGHTIILSRGLIDVVPDDAALAAVLAHELALTTLDDRSFTRFSWADETRFGARDVPRTLRFVPSDKQEEQAASLAREWMSNSPYRNSLDSVARFSEELHVQSPHIRHLLQASIGDSVYKTLDAAGAPQDSLTAREAGALHFLPLTGKTELDPLSNRLTLLQAEKMQTLSKAAGLPFEASAAFLDLRRDSGEPSLLALQPAPRQ
jgi:hypothetical protein